MLVSKIKLYIPDILLLIASLAWLSTSIYFIAGAVILRSITELIEKRIEIQNEIHQKIREILKRIYLISGAVCIIRLIVLLIQ